jgi:hypothetical protein
MSFYSDGCGPYYMGMSVHTALIPKDLFILQGKDMEVIYADSFKEARA